MVGLHSLGVVIDHQALEAAIDNLLTSQEQCQAMGVAGEERVKALFHFNHVCKQYRELWLELKVRRQKETCGNSNKIWPMASAARLFANHASNGAWEGPWQINDHCTDPSILIDKMQSCFINQIMAMMHYKSFQNY